MKFVFNDGGRKAAGFEGKAGDCVARAIAIVAELPYIEVYNKLAEGNGTQRRSKHCKKPEASARNGVFVKRKWFKDYMASLGFKFTATMGIGTGCKVHLRDGELPIGRLIVAVSKHYTAVINGVVNDTYNPERKTGRCVYGYWSKSS
jgi:hypothetical protein